MKREEVNVAPDGSLLLNPFEVERQLRYHLAAMDVMGLVTTSKHLSSLVKQAMWELDAKLLRIVVEAIVAQVAIDPGDTHSYALLCQMVVKNKQLGSSDFSVQDVVAKACQQSYETFWRQMLMTMLAGTYAAAERQHLRTAPRSQGNRGRALLLFIGYLYGMDVVPEWLVMHIVLEHGRNAIELPEDCLENFACLMEIVGCSLARRTERPMLLALVLKTVETAAEHPKMSMRARQILRDMLLSCYNWDLDTHEEPDSVPREIPIGHLEKSEFHTEIG